MSKQIFIFINFYALFLTTYIDLRNRKLLLVLEISPECKINIAIAPNELLIDITSEKKVNFGLWVTSVLK